MLPPGPLWTTIGYVVVKAAPAASGPSAQRYLSWGVEAFPAAYAVDPP